MTAWAKVGAKCVCVNVSGGSVLPGTLSKLVKGEVYTIHALETVNGKSCCRVSGNGMYPSEYERMDVWLHLARFKPVALAKHTEVTDVALFTHHLTDQPVDA